MSSWEGDSMRMGTEAHAMGRAGGLSTPLAGTLWLMLVQAGQGQKMCESRVYSSPRGDWRRAWKRHQWRGHKAREALTCHQ